MAQILPNFADSVQSIVVRLFLMDRPIRLRYPLHGSDLASLQGFFFPPQSLSQGIGERFPPDHLIRGPERRGIDFSSHMKKVH
jgi:hypothetical protein